MKYELNRIQVFAKTGDKHLLVTNWDSIQKSNEKHEAYLEVMTGDKVTLIFLFYFRPVHWFDRFTHLFDSDIHAFQVALPSSESDKAYTIHFKSFSKILTILTTHDNSVVIRKHIDLIAIGTPRFYFGSNELRYNILQHIDA